MIFLTVDELVGINERLVGPGQLRDRNLLESAAQRPSSSAGGRDAYPDVHSKAAALFHSIASNHPFVDGNKRTAVLAVAVFYGFNGFGFEADDTDLIHVAVDAVIGNLDVAGIAEYLSKWARPLSDPPTDSIGS